MLVVFPRTKVVCGRDTKSRAIFFDFPALEPQTEARVRGSARVEIKKYIFCEGFVKENRNSKKQGLENFWSMDFQSDLTFYLVNIF